MTYYLVDGSEDCFYTAVFDGYNDKGCAITSRRDLQLGLDTAVKEITADEQKAKRVKKKICEYDSAATNDISLALRSCADNKEQTAFEYIRLLIKHRRPVRTMLNIPAVFDMDNMRSRVTGELHNMKGFLRFMENDKGVLYAPYSPDNDITDLLAPHFAERLKNQKFVIHDIKRKKAALYDGNEIVVCYADGADVYLSEYEQAFEELWRLYYKSVNITERPHDRQMKGYMPVRYWKFLPEKKDNI